MADRNYGDLTQVTSAASGDGLVLDQDGTTVGITTANLLKPTGSDANTVTGTAGSNGRLVSWNADGDAVDSGIAAADVLTTVDLAANVTGVLPIANGGTGGATAAAARTALGVDAAGTDNSTDVTLAGAFDYLTIAGQVISLGAIDLAADVTGALPVANGGTGATTASGARAALGVDPAGTDNSTDVTIAAGRDYITIAGQALTLGAVDLTTDVTGTLPAANGGTGVTALSSLDVASFGSGAASNGHVLTADGSGGASFQAASGGGSGDFMADGSVAMTGAFDTDVGTFTSGVADGASAVAYDYDTTNPIATSGGLLARWRNNGTAAVQITKDGDLYLLDGARLYLERAGGAGVTSIMRSGSTLSIDTGLLMNGNNIGSLSRIAFANNTPTITGDNSGNVFINAGVVTAPSTSTDTHVDGDGNLIVNALTRINGAYTVAGLPTGTLGDIARVTDASSPSVGSTVSGGGAADALVWFNGSSWTVTGV